jgi:CheY-like chemotaxis protein
MAASREMRFDLSRRMEARRRQQAAIVACADAHLRRSGGVLRSSCELRAVIAHRNEWMAQKLTTLMTAQEVRVVGTFTDGADAAGTVVAEQPDLVFVEDRLSTLTGADVVREARQYSPASVIGAQVLDSEGVAALVTAGAHAVFRRQTPPADIVDQLLRCLGADRGPQGTTPLA